MFLPGWEEGLLPHQRSLDDQGRAGLEEERRLAHVGLTRARRRAKIYFVSNRRMRGAGHRACRRGSSMNCRRRASGFRNRSEFGGFSGYGNVGGSRFDRMARWFELCDAGLAARDAGSASGGAGGAGGTQSGGAPAGGEHAGGHPGGRREVGPRRPVERDARPAAR